LKKKRPLRWNLFEQKIDKQLKKSKLPYKYEPEKIPYVLAGHYIPDFGFNTDTGRVLLECKGYLRPEHKRKMVAVKRQHPELDIRIVFYRHNKSYIKWAEKCGFKWAVDTIPQEWLNGF